MGRFGFFSLALLSVQALIGGSLAADAAEKEEAPESPLLSVSAHASFPASEIFGVKLVNGHPTQALITFANEEPAPVTVNFIGGTLSSLEEDSQIIRNLTSHRYSIEIPAGQQESVSYSFAVEMHPQDLRLALASVISDADGNLFTLYAHNGTVSVVEPETSIFDPQIIFLYFFLLACFSGVTYFFYTVWIAPYFPQKRRSTKPEPKKSTTSKKEAPVEAPTSPAVSSATTYNAEWIPSHHINRPEARKVKGAGAKAKSRAA
ncbi:translocon-associated protein, alpha subunit [Aspergillus heteromorphus CBS 117.55]|uniref:Translocon-associated protein, alpha subunit n=1 Tax=Aspergillus heteromorphus CBS 117.55 TaxID=1448321 RepID=A0A317WVV3_9EURO|nr:translocon-associated protein, alpha subunit [Aspergillus heteromorphus CBS 117.55]PWY88988.1 translocon-associated protein, alpha subunit [Aspergillus heteromorphus CBS 117.55]